jgi:hypothetical protein
MVSAASRCRKTRCKDYLEFDAEAKQYSNHDGNGCGKVANASSGSDLTCLSSASPLDAPGWQPVASAGLISSSAVAAADGGVVHHEAAGTATLEHGGEAVATALDHLAALGVAAGTRDAAAVVGHLALAQAHGEVAAADHHAVHIMQAMLVMPPASIWQRFCIMAHAAASSQRQVIFIPPVHFSTLKVQRGTMIMFGAIGAATPPIGVEPMPGVVMPGMPITFRSIIIALVMIVTP